MALSSLRRAILVKRETVYGTDSVPVAATDGVLVRSINLSGPVVVESVDREQIRPFFGGFQQLQGSAFTTVEIEMEVCGFGTAGPAAPTPGYDALLRCCGLSRTIVASTSVTYAPISTALESATVYFYSDGKLYRGVGCFANVRMSMTVGGIPVYRFTLTGRFVATSDAALVTPVLTAYQTPLLVNATNTNGVQLHTHASILQAFEFDLGNQIETRELVGSLPEVTITGRAPSGRVEIEDTLVAARNWTDIVRNATIGNFTILHGTAVGNRVAFNSNRAQLTSIRENIVQNLVHASFDMRFPPTTAGGDDFSLVIT